MMKTMAFLTSLLAVLLIVATLPALAAAVTPLAPTWTVVAHFGDRIYQGVDFGDEMHGYLLADYCGYVTSDGGHTWTAQPDVSGMTSVKFVSPTQAWLVGRDAIEMTTDAGQTWTAQTSGAVGDIWGFDAFDSDHAWVSTSACEIIATTDGGSTWAKIGDAPAGSFGRLEFADATHGWALRGDNLYASTDAGATWARRSPVAGAQSDDLSLVKFLDAQHGWISNVYTGLWRTTDGGLTWQESEPHLMGITDVAALDPLRVWSIDTRCRPRISTDGGCTWRLQTCQKAEISTCTFQLDVIGDHAWAAPKGSRESWGVVHTDTDGFSDADPPVTSITSPLPAEWSAVPVTLDFSIADEGSGPGETYCRVGLGEWQVGPSFTLLGSAGEGKHSISYFSTDAYGNQEEVRRLSVGLDFTAPVTKLIAAGPGDLDYWTNNASFITAQVSDGRGSGVAHTYVNLDAGGWMLWNGTSLETPAPRDHSNDGVHTIVVRSIDMVGNVENDQDHIVAIDTRRPRAAAPYAASCAYHGDATLKFKIVDRRPCASKGAVRIKIRTTGGRLVGIVNPGKWYAKNRVVSVRFHCPLARGVYRFAVQAYDGAGNVSAKTATNTLVIR